MLGLNDTLPLHLQLAMMRFFASSGGWNGLNTSWNSFMPSFAPLPQNPFDAWNDLLQKQAAEAKRDQEKRRRDRARKQNPGSDNPFAVFFEHPAFKAALANEAFDRTQSFLEGIAAVTQSEYVRQETPYKVVWEHGHCRVLDYAPRAGDAVAVFIVPSLINRASVLDIHPDCSFVKYLVQQGFRPLLLDWGEPDDDTLAYGCADYISGKALPAFSAMRAMHDGPLTLLGYCMGGVFAVAMAQLAGRVCDALMLLATPWDFSAPDSPRVALPGPATIALRQSLSLMNPVPSSAINLCFHLIDPWAVQKRYQRFSGLSGLEKELFLAVEHWLSEGVPMAQKVAIEAFVDWPQDNILHTGKFVIGRSWIEPQRITCPTFAVIPEHDRIVPSSCAEPLAARIPKCRSIAPALGHVSMMASPCAREQMWEPLARWLKQRFN